MDPEQLHLLINEDIYIIEENGEEPEASTNVDQMEKMPEEPVSDPIAEKTIETPRVIPNEDLVKPMAKTIPLAVFHESKSEEDKELLQKIIEACKLAQGSYEVFENGFNKEIMFRKALVFVEKSKAFYEPIPYQKSEILCARPLGIIAANQEEKAKLWSALKQFV